MSYEEIEFPFAVTNEETYLMGSYTQLFQAQESIKKFKEYKKVQIQELNEKKRLRKSQKAASLDLGNYIKRSSKDSDLSSNSTEAKKAKLDTTGKSKTQDEPNPDPDLNIKPEKLSQASSNTEALKKLIASGKFSLHDSANKSVIRRGGKNKTPLKPKNFSSFSENPELEDDGIDERVNDINEAMETEDQNDLENNNNNNNNSINSGQGDDNGEEKPKTYTDTPNHKIKVYLGPNYQEPDVRKIFGQYGEIKRITMLPSSKYNKTSEICVVTYNLLDSAINAKNELHATSHKEFVAKISVTFIKKEKTGKNQRFKNKSNKNIGDLKGVKNFGIGKNFEKNRTEIGQENPEMLGRKIISYDDEDLFD